MDRGKASRVSLGFRLSWSSNKVFISVFCAVGVFILFIPTASHAIFGFFEKTPEKQTAVPLTVPPEYKGKTMPAGWGSDPKIMAAGKTIFEGKMDPEFIAPCVTGKTVNRPLSARGLPIFPIQPEPMNRLTAGFG